MTDSSTKTPFGNVQLASLRGTGGRAPARWSEEHASLAATAHAAAAVQTAAAGMDGRRLTRAAWERLRAGGRGLGPGCPVAAAGGGQAAPRAAAAFLRILAQEAPGCEVAVGMVDGHECPDGLGPETGRAAPGTDMYGTISTAGALVQPRLLAQEPAQPSRAWPRPAEHLHGVTLVTGGLGSLGMLCSLWIAGQSGAGAALALLGRSGRAGGESPLPGRLLRSDAQVHVARADVGSTTELDGLIYWLEREAGPLAPIKACMRGRGRVGSWRGA